MLQSEVDRSQSIHSGSKPRLLPDRAAGHLVWHWIHLSLVLAVETLLQLELLAYC